MKNVKYMLLLFITSFLFFNIANVKALNLNLSNNNQEIYVENIFSTNYYANEEDENAYKFETEDFCNQTNIKKVFRALGFVITIIKIAVPILLIVFGSIDFGKAVISSKDDEIKKALHSLTIRAIAGIVIFLIPTMINFVVKLVGGEDVYNTTFGPCTKCILTPSACEIEEIAEE